MRSDVVVVPGEFAPLVSGGEQKHLAQGLLVGHPPATERIVQSQIPHKILFARFPTGDQVHTVQHFHQVG